MAGGRGPQGRRHMTVSQAMKAAGSGNLNRVIRMIFEMYGGTLLAVVLFIAVAAVVLSCVFRYVPLFSGITSGFSVILCAVAAAALAALKKPVEVEK